MEVRPEHKLSEIGVIPKNWEVRHLKDVSRKITDGDHVTPRRTSQGYYLLSARNVLNGRIDVSDVDYVGAVEYQRMKQRCGPAAGDVLISCSGTIGRVAVVPLGFECVLVRSAALAKINNELADGVFLQYWLQSSRAQGQIANSVNQGAQPNLFLNHIERLLCPRPPLPEQRAIATALSEVDALGGALDRLIAKKRDLKQAAMQQLLTGKTRLPGFNGAWETKSLAAICSMKSGEAITSANIDQFSKYPCYGGNGIRGYTSRFTHNGSYTLIGRQGALCGNVFGVEGKFFASEHAIVVTASSTADIQWLAFVLGRMNLNQYSESSAQPGLSVSKILKLNLSAPPTKAEQTAIAALLSDMDAELAALEQRRDKTRALKQGMMQELLTGRIRLVTPICEAAQPAKTEQKKAAHNWQINEAVIIAALAAQFGTEKFPLARVRRVKLTYLLHRYVERKAEGYLKKAAGPYNPKTRYQGPETIALKNGYVRECNNGKYDGFVAGEKIAQAKAYFAEWYPGAQQWVEQFHFKTTDELELLATVDMAMEDLRSGGRPVEWQAVKEIIRLHPEWQAKLDRPIFSDSNIERAINDCKKLFGGARVVES